MLSYFSTFTEEHHFRYTVLDVYLADIANLAGKQLLITSAFRRYEYWCK